jgi:hypothetical protein
VGAGVSVEEPLCGLGSRGWNARVREGSEKSVVVPHVRRGGWDTGGRDQRRWRRGTSEVSLLRLCARARTQDIGTRDAEWHGPGLDHVGPWVQPGSPRTARWPSCSVGGGTT